MVIRLILSYTFILHLTHMCSAFRMGYVFYLPVNCLILPFIFCGLKKGVSYTFNFYTFSDNLREIVVSVGCW